MYRNKETHNPNDSEDDDIENNDSDIHSTATASNAEISDSEEESFPTPAPIESFPPYNCSVKKNTQLSDSSSIDAPNLNVDFNFESFEAPSRKRKFTSRESPSTFFHADTESVGGYPASVLNRLFPENAPYSAVTRCTENLSLEIISPVLPHYKSYQLIGDSQLLRFSEQILNYEDCVELTENGNRRIGYCVSGQTSVELLQRLRKNEYIISSNIILLMGTCDLLQQVPAHSICYTLIKILMLLERAGVLHIVVLTVPPIPKYAVNVSHWDNLTHINNFLMKIAKAGKIFVLDLASLFVSYSNTISLEYFESEFPHFPNPSFIHLNKNGFKLLKSILDIQYFEKIELK